MRFRPAGFIVDFDVEEMEELSLACKADDCRAMGTLSLRKAVPVLDITGKKQLI